jgi:RNA polymerase sigma factor (sigma-70 family)
MPVRRRGGDVGDRRSLGLKLGSPTARAGADPASEDAALVAAAQRDRQGFAPLYEAYADRVFRYALARTGSVSVADDVVSDTMLAALEGIGRFDASQGSLAGWLFAIAARKLADRGRQQGRVRRVLARRWTTMPPDLDDDALEIVIRADDARMVRLLLGRLPASDRELVLLRYSADLNAAEIADTLEISHGAARMRLSRAIGRLSHDLQAMGDE